MRYRIIRHLAILAIVCSAGLVHADGLPEDVTYGVCLTGADHRFGDAALGYAAPGAVVSSPPHWHGPYIRDLIGQCFIGRFVLREDSVRGFPEQHHVLVYYEIVSQDAAMLAGDRSRSDGYIEDTDIEGARQKGLGSSGSTPSHTGRRRGDE